MTDDARKGKKDEEPKINEVRETTGILKKHQKGHPSARKKVSFKKVNKNTRSRQGKKPMKKVSKNCNILYANANGISGKMDSLKTAAKMQNAHIITITETKTTGSPPQLDGYTWISKGRTGRLGGGVAMAIRNDIEKNVTQILDLEDQNQEILWTQVKHGNQKTFIGTYYGPQESANREDVETEYSQITTQIAKLKEKGQVILTGDFNAKIKINKSHCKQACSRNGKMMEKMMKQNAMTPATVDQEGEIWTRVKRKNTDEKSVIDYIITTDKIAQQIQEVNVDQHGLYRLKGKEESDHNTILMTVNLNIQKETLKIKKICNGNKEGWTQFNSAMETKHEESPCTNYEMFQTRIMDTIEQTVGIKTITINKDKKWEPEETKKRRQQKKEAKETLNKAIRTQSDNKQPALSNYLDAQWRLRESLNEHEKKSTEEKINKITKACENNMNEFWKLRRKMLGKNDHSMYNTLSEEGDPIEDPDDAKEHIAQYFENLYQARPGKPEYEEWTKKIEDSVKEINEAQKSMPDPEPITKKEMNAAIRTLKRNKAPGPDGIPNEAMIEANQKTREMYREVINEILKVRTPPEQWQKGHIKRLFKGKGKIGMCSNERGITLASNVGKLYERIVNNRVTEDVDMTQAQAGGQKGKSTTDHILIIKELIQKAREQKKPLYIAFLDVTKAYDKAWLDAIMYVMHKSGLRDSLWQVVKNLNENLTAQLQTKYGLTRDIKIKDSIRQGGVLSVVQYALLIDEISKEIQKYGLGDMTEGLAEIIACCLLWMDDVALIATDPKNLQTMLDITDETANRYHVEFGEPKSKILKIGKVKTLEEFKLGEVTLEFTDKYKYLGEIFNNKGNLKDHISEIKGKAEAAYQTLLKIAGNKHFHNIQMKAIWKLVETCIVPILTYGGETRTPTKKENKEINNILDNIIKRIIMVPRTTPREVLYIETGLMDIEHICMRNRINMEKRLNLTPDSITYKAKENGAKYGWKYETEKLKTKLKVMPEDMQGSREHTKSAAKIKVKNQFIQEMEVCGRDKSKVRHLLDHKEEAWSPGKPAQYMMRMTRNQASTIFKAKTRMLDIKNNFRNKYANSTCRACKVTNETQEHVLNECQILHPNETTKVSNQELAMEDPEVLINVSKKIEKLMTKLEENGRAPNNNNNPNV